MTKISNLQTAILLSAVRNFGVATGGDAGWNTKQLDRLAKLGLLRFLGKTALESRWVITPAGRDIVKENVAL